MPDPAVTVDLPDFGRARVLVAGDLMLDRYWYGDTSRISPEAPVPIVRVADREDRVGGAGNVAMNIAALGARASVLGQIGDDEAGTRLAELLRARDCHPALHRAADFATITKLRVMSQHQQLIRLDFEDARAICDATALLTQLRVLLPEVDVLVLSDYAKGALLEPEPFIQAARACHIPVLVDPKRADLVAYRGATLLTPNFREFQQAVGPCADERTVAERGARLLDDLQLEALLLTRGEQGMMLFRPGLAPLVLPAHAREVYDVTGAGDTVIATTGAALAAGVSMETAARLANLAAGIVVGKMGTATATAAELRAELRPAAMPGSPSAGQVVDEVQLLERVTRARAAGETLVMTNGCFDLLHPGHVRYLEEAARLGDRLIVAVNDDASVRRLKGTGRPVVTLPARQRVLAGLRAVDWVTSFSEDTPERLICQVRPDVLVKGGDYRPEQVAGGRCVEESGGEVRIVSFVDGHSTSAIVNRLTGAGSPE